MSDIECLADVDIEDCDIFDGGKKCPACKEARLEELATYHASVGDPDFAWCPRCGALVDRNGTRPTRSFNDDWQRLP